MKTHFFKVAIYMFLLSNFTNLNEIKSQTPVYGITLCGAEFGENSLPGQIGKHYTYPTVEEIEYFASKGVDLIQLPVKWERIQRTLGGNLDAIEMSYILKFVDECNRKNIKVNIVLQNFGRYNYNGKMLIVGGPYLKAWHLADFWQKMAKVLSYKKNIFAFSIMTEPYEMAGYNWPLSAQEVVNAIREVDFKTTIIIDGDNYSNPATWLQYNDKLKYITDPANNMMFNAHCYFDYNFSGRYHLPYDKDGAHEWIGVERLQPFVQWLKKNNKKGYVGEFGIPKNDKKWLKVMENFLNYTAANGLSASYWAAGPWWKDYSLSIEPINNIDQPQMILFAKYFNNKTNYLNTYAVSK